MHCIGWLGPISKSARCLKDINYFVTSLSANNNLDILKEFSVIQGTYFYGIYQQKHTQNSVFPTFHLNLTLCYACLCVLHCSIGYGVQLILIHNHLWGENCPSTYFDVSVRLILYV